MVNVAILCMDIFSVFALSTIGAHGVLQSLHVIRIVLCMFYHVQTNGIHMCFQCTRQKTNVSKMGIRISVKNKEAGKNHHNVQVAPTYIECMIHVRCCKKIERNHKPK